MLNFVTNNYAVIKKFIKLSYITIIVDFLKITLKCLIFKTINIYIEIKICDSNLKIYYKTLQFRLIFVIFKIF